MELAAPLENRGDPTSDHALLAKVITVAPPEELVSAGNAIYSFPLFPTARLGAPTPPPVNEMSTGGMDDQPKPNIVLIKAMTVI